ncbi:hypothetical protein JYT11_01020, partial [Planctomycetaceae bacterium AH-315-I19]|nr:hypothetical protein [Planctomycetaceae bacterium AH-315-I19]
GVELRVKRRQGGFGGGVWHGFASVPHRTRGQRPQRPIGREKAGIFGTFSNLSDRSADECV